MLIGKNNRIRFADEAALTAALAAGAIRAATPATTDVWAAALVLFELNFQWRGPVPRR